MAKRSNQNLIVGLDIGTSKIVVLVAEESLDGQLEITGYGSHPSNGLKKGVVVNIDATVQSIQRAVEEAELMSGCQIHSAFTGIAGNHIRSLNSHGIVAIRSQQVNEHDVERVIDAAKAVAIPADQQMLHVLPQEFIIDMQEGIREPVGMSGVRLESRVHIVTGAVSAVQNIINCVQQCGLQCSDIILEQLASSYSVLTEDEKNLGVCVIDIGAGTTDIAIFTDGAIRHTAVIPIAGSQVTSDIAVALRTSTQVAEEIKLEHGSVATEQVKNQKIAVPAVGEQTEKEVPLQLLTHVIEARYEELFSLVHAELRRSGFEQLISSGIVLTGGASKVAGATTLAESVFHTSVRIGAPQNISGMSEIINNPIHATGVGLLLYGQKQMHHPRMNMPMQRGVKSVMGRMKSWFQGNF